MRVQAGRARSAAGRCTWPRPHPAAAAAAAAWGPQPSTGAEGRACAAPSCWPRWRCARGAARGGRDRVGGRGPGWQRMAAAVWWVVGAACVSVCGAGAAGMHEAKCHVVSFLPKLAHRVHPRPPQAGPGSGAMLVSLRILRRGSTRGCRVRRPDTCSAAWLRLGRCLLLLLSRWAAAGCSQLGNSVCRAPRSPHDTRAPRPTRAKAFQHGVELIDRSRALMLHSGAWRLGLCCLAEMA